VSDDAVGALLCLRRLRFLSLIDTGVGMPGLRRFASAMHAERRAVDVAIPVHCEEYVRSKSCSFPDCSPRAVLE
jgi:hypothetical protein